MSLPILHFRKQIEDLSNFEKRRLSDWTFSEIKEMLLREEILWSDLPTKKEPPKRFPIGQFLLEVPSFRPKKITRSFLLKCVGEKETVKGEIYRLYKITIVLDEEEMSPSYKIMIKSLFKI